MLGKVQRRRPYNLGKHSNSNKNFEIHIFTHNIIPGKSGMLQNSPPQKNLVLEIEASLGTMEYRTSSSCLRASSIFSFIVVAFWSLPLVYSQPKKISRSQKLFQDKVDLDLHLLSLMSSLEYTWGSFVMNLLLLLCFLIFKQFQGSGWVQREYSLIQVSNLISNCMRWLIQNLDLIFQCRPSLLQFG
jgi:hypothetical protein